MEQQTGITYPQGLERALIVVTAILAALLQLVDTSIVNVSLREISGSIGATTTEIAWTVTAYAVSNVIMIPLSGMFSDLFGRRNYFTISILIFTIASFFCGTSNSLWTLVIWRFIQGLGGGALLTSAQTIIVEAFPPEKIDIANAIFGMGVILGPTFGPTLGGYLTDNYSWHWIFFINVPLGALAAILSWTYVKDRRGARKPEKVDRAGIFYLIIAVSTLQYVLEEGLSKDWFTSREITIVSIISVLGIVLFIWRELTTAYPAVNLKLIGHWNVALGMLLNLILGMILFATIFAFPLFAQIGLGWTATMTGNFMIPGALASAVSIGMTGRLLSKGVNAKLIVITGCLMTFVFGVMMSFSSPDSSGHSLFWAFILRGLGMGFMMAPIMSLALKGLHGSDMGQAVGLTNMVRQLGGAVGIAIMNLFLQHIQASNDNVLLQNMGNFNPAFQERFNVMVQNFMANGYYRDDAEAAAYKLLDGMLLKQQLLVSYDNIFWYVAVAVLFCIPLVFLIRNQKAASGAPEIGMIHE